MRNLIAMFLILATLPAAAQAPKVLSFSQWKAQQVTEAQNRVTRLSNKLTLIKSETANLRQPIKQLEAELLGATQGAEIAKEFTIDHYVATYLTLYTDSREALLALAQITSKDEMADLLLAILKTRPSPNITPSSMTSMPNAAQPAM